MNCQKVEDLRLVPLCRLMNIKWSFMQGSLMPVIFFGLQLDHQKGIFGVIFIPKYDFFYFKSKLIFFLRKVLANPTNFGSKIVNL